MKAKFSPLQLLDFKLLESHVEFVIPKESELDVKELFQSYAVEIDFRLRENEQTKEILLFTTVEVNGDDDKPLPGYKIMVEGGGTFSIQNPDTLEENLKNNLIQFSTLNMMINNLRNIIYQITNLGPMGGYLLPPIDITQLLRDKAGKEISSTKLMEDHTFNGFRYYSTYENGELPKINHHKQLPEYLFKFYSLSHHNIEALINSHFYASHPYELNDILDSSRFLFFSSKPIQFEAYEKLYFQENKVFKTEKELIKFYEDDIKNDCSKYLSSLFAMTSDFFGVFSLSEKENNILVWPHYTQEKGFQIKFKTDGLLKSVSENLDPKKDRLLGLFPMNYTPKIPPIDISKFRRYDIPFIYSTNVKQDQWKYEQEWRLLVSKPKMGIPFEKLGFSDFKNYNFDPDKRYINYNLDVIDSICLGFNFFSGSDFINKWISEKEIQVQPRKERDKVDLRQQFDLYIKFLDFIINTFSGRVYLSTVKYEKDKDDNPYLIRTKERVDLTKLDESKYLIVRTGEIVKFN